MQSEVIFKSSDRCIESFTEHNNTRLAYTFTHLGNRELRGMGYGGAELMAAGYDVVAIKSAVDDWFQGLSESAIESVAKAMSKKHYERIVTYGGSMGGFGAIALAGRLGADTALAFSPQIDLSTAFDKRWENLQLDLPYKYAITRLRILKTTTIIVVYDPYDIDGQHAEIAKAACADGKFVGIELPFVGHSTSLYLADIKILRRLMLQLLDVHHAEGFDLKRGRRSSPIYASHFARYLYNRGKSRSAVILAEHGCRLKPDDTESLRVASIAYQALGQYAQAVAAASKLALLEPAVGTYEHLSYLQVLASDWQGALSTLDMGLALDPHHENMIQRRQFILAR